MTCSHFGTLLEFLFSPSFPQFLLWLSSGPQIIPEGSSFLIIRYEKTMEFFFFSMSPSKPITSIKIWNTGASCTLKFANSSKGLSASARLRKTVQTECIFLFFSLLKRGDCWSCERKSDFKEYFGDDMNYIIHDLNLYFFGLKIIIMIVIIIIIVSVIIIDKIIINFRNIIIMNFISDMVIIIISNILSSSTSSSKYS